MLASIAGALPFAVGYILKSSAASLAVLVVARTIGRRRPGLALDLALVLFGSALVFSFLPAMPARAGGEPRGLSISLPAAVQPEAAGEEAVRLAGAEAPQRSAGEGGVPALTSLLGLGWMLGCLVLVLWRLHAWARIEGLMKGAKPPEGKAFLKQAEVQAARLGLKAPPELRIVKAAASPLGASPFVARSVGQIVAFPESALGWPEIRLGFGLLHEFAHVKRHDNLRLGFLRAASILAWPSPLPWLALAECANLRERACDEKVLSCGGEASAYAAELLAAARQGRRSSRSTRFAAMASRKGIDMRIRSILDREGAAKAPSGLERSAALIALAAALLSFAFVGAAFSENGSSPQAHRAGALATGQVLDMALPLDAGWRLTQSYGYHENPFDGKPYLHWEIDLGAEWGSPVRAAARGSLVDSGFDRQMGYFAVLEHESGLRSRYTHLARPVAAAKGAELERGAFLGSLGSSGTSTGPHLGFAVLEKEPDGGWRETDPLPFLARSSEPLILEAVRENVLINNLDELRSILLLKPDLNRSLPDGSLPLESVLVMGNCEAARILVGSGADPSRATKSGRSVLELARESGNETLASILAR